MFSLHVSGNASPNLGSRHFYSNDYTVGGQGIASGFRDAVALSWRLVLMCQSARIDTEQALKGWYSERKQQLESSLASTVRNGDLVNSKNSVKIFMRNWILWLLQLVPPIKRWIELGPQQNGRMQYKHSEGMPFLTQLPGGMLFSQTYCCGLGGVGDGDVCFTDDVIFAPEKKGLFQIVVLLHGDQGELQESRDVVAGLGSVCPHLHPAEATYFVRRQRAAADANSTLGKQSSLSNVHRTASAEEFNQSSLCKGRPPAYGYREYDMWSVVRDRRYVILRADRFVFAACNSARELQLAAARLNEIFTQ